jgi:hypothetical protein
MLVRCFWEAVTSNSPFAVNLSQGFMRQELEMVERQHQQQHHRTIPSFPSFLHPLQPHSLGSNTFRTALHRTTLFWARCTQKNFANPRLAVQSGAVSPPG